MQSLEGVRHISGWPSIHLCMNMFHYSTVLDRQILFILSGIFSVLVITEVPFIAHSIFIIIKIFLNILPKFSVPHLRPLSYSLVIDY